VEILEIIGVENASYWYPEKNEPALDNINLSINEGEFVLVVGPSGCGKSTLLRMLNRIVPDYYGGKLKGSVLLNNKNIREYNKKDIIEKVGMVYQHPEKQIVMQDVEREIAFGLENLNTPLNKMKRNVAEVISFLNLSHIKDKSTQEISGGEKQRIAIASVMAMDPDIMLLDEPTSQLDPIASEEVLSFIKRLNRDTGKTIVLVEQRLDRCFDMADRIIFMENGIIAGQGTPNNIPESIDKRYFLPSITYLFKQAGYVNPPVNVKQGRELIKNIDFDGLKALDNRLDIDIINVSKLNFGYEKNKKVLKDINLSIKKGEIMAVVGENGAGKSTLFKIIAGMLDEYKGRVTVSGKDISEFSQAERINTIGYLSQNPNDYLGRDTVFDEIAYTLRNIDAFDSERVEDMLLKLELAGVRDRKPRDLSGGEKQRLAIACTMVSNPDILILDEPTRGLDSVNKEKLGEILTSLSDEGKTIVLITHDSDFAGDYTHRVTMMFSGEIVATGRTEDILNDAIYYSPQISKLFKNKCKIVRFRDGVKALKVIK
jgi:energy-coupling factor transport system ATP-binding protein